MKNDRKEFDIDRKSTNSYPKPEGIIQILSPVINRLISPSALLNFCKHNHQFYSKILFLSKTSFLFKITFMIKSLFLLFNFNHGYVYAFCVYVIVLFTVLRVLWCSGQTYRMANGAWPTLLFTAPVVTV